MILTIYSARVQENMKALQCNTTYHLPKTILGYLLRYLFARAQLRDFNECSTTQTSSHEYAPGTIQTRNTQLPSLSLAAMAQGYAKCAHVMVGPPGFATPWKRTFWPKKSTD